MTLPKGLEAEGFRFVLQDGEFGWVHPNLIKPDAVDITDLPEPEFNAFVERELLKRDHKNDTFRL